MNALRVVTTMDFHTEIDQLRRELERAGYEYYVLDKPTMSDYDYDHKLRRLEELEQAHPETVTPDSPTQRVGGQALSTFEPVQHRVPLESLQDVSTLTRCGPLTSGCRAR